MSNPVALERIFSTGFWEKAWAGIHGNSFLQSSQKSHPERWRQFYEEAGPLLSQVSGYSAPQGRHVVRLLAREGLIAPGRTVVDLGCGTGWLSVPLAAMGAEVMSVDLSRSMIRTLRDTASRLKLEITAHEISWTDLSLSGPLDLSLAAFFPEALFPDGLRRMESLGRRCAVILGTGVNGPSWTAELWRVLSGTVPSGGGRHALTAINWLMAAGRRPNLLHLTIDTYAKLPLESVMTFYRRYFSMFDYKEQSIDVALSRVLRPFTRKETVTARGQGQLCVIWWLAPDGGNACA